MPLRSFNFSSPSRQQERFYPWCLAALAVVLYLPGLGARDLWPPVEPRYAEIARVMLANREWVVSTVNGALYTDKPILYFWLVLAASTVAGSVNEWTLRLPAALSGIGLVLAVYRLGRDFFTPRVGFLAAAILATCALVVWDARWAHVDLTFTLCFTLAMLFFARAILDEQRRGDFLSGYAMAGLATLSKGIIGALLPALILVAFAAVRRDWRALLRWRIPLGALIFLAVAAPWFVLISSATGGQWIKEFILTHHVVRFATGFHYRAGWSYYLRTLPLDLLPWSIFAVPAFFAYRRRLKSLQEPRRLLLFLWFAVVFVFFNLSRAKRGLYLLPLVPPAALFIAVYFDGLIAGEISAGALWRRIGNIFFSALGLASLALLYFAWSFDRELFSLSLPLALLLATWGLATAATIRRNLPSGTFIATAATVLVGAIYVSLWVSPFFNRYESSKTFLLAVGRSAPPGAPLYAYADMMNELNFYSGRETIPMLRSPDDLAAVMSQKPSGYLLIRERDLYRFKDQPALRDMGEADAGKKKWRLLRWGE